LISEEVNNRDHFVIAFNNNSKKQVLKEISSSSNMPESLDWPPTRDGNIRMVSSFLLLLLIWFWILG
jgi:hypothetical protein